MGAEEGTQGIRWKRSSELRTRVVLKKRRGI